MMKELNDMKHVQMGKTELVVNPIGLGANAVGGHNIYPNIDEEVSKELVRRAISLGMNFIDTAYYYGLGRSEELIGEVLKESGIRQNVVIATKVGPKIVNQQRVMDNTPAFLKAEVEKSLKRLQTDYIDLIYIHFPDQDTPKDEAVGALAELKQEGKVRAIGVSNFTLDQLKEANQDGYVDVYQGEYNLLSRSAEQNLFPYLREHHISFVPYYPLASGLLTGKFSKDTPVSDYRKRLAYFKEEAYIQNIEKVEQLRELAKSKEVEVAHLVLAWYLTRPEIDAIIPGAKRVEQIQQNLKTLEVTLTEEEIRQIDQLFS